MRGSVTAPLLALGGALLLSGCFEAPPIESEQIGADGVGHADHPESGPARRARLP